MKIQKAFIHVHSSIKSQRIIGLCAVSQLAANLCRGVCFKFSVRCICNQENGRVARGLRMLLLHV